MAEAALRCPRCKSRMNIGCPCFITADDGAVHFGGHRDIEAPSDSGSNARAVSEYPTGSAK